MYRMMLALTLTLLPFLTAFADVPGFPPGFRSERIATNGAEIHTRIGGKGPAVLLVHGYGETGDMWAPLAAALAVDHTVVVPDLRGMGLSSKPASGYEKRVQALDIAGVLDALKIDRVELVTHDIGNMVGYALAAQFPSRVTRFVIMDAPLPGIGPWDDLVRSRALWHFGFGGPDAERLVAGRERIYLDRFWNEFSADPRRFSEASRQHYAALYAQPGAMHAGFQQFAAFEQDAADNRKFVAQGKLTMPVLAVGGQQSFGPTMATVMRFVAVNVQEEVIPDSGHWLMEEQPAATVTAILAFLAKPLRLTPPEIDRLGKVAAGPGTSGVAGIRTTVLYGNPSAGGLYAIRLVVPPRVRIEAHVHRDERTAIVIAGKWQLGYGGAFDGNQLKLLPPGSFYTEPAGVPHYAQSGDEPAVVDIVGYGPTDTAYLQ